MSEALREAATVGDLDRVRQLLAQGADPTHANEWGFDALGLAAWEGHRHVVSVLAQGRTLDLDGAAAADDVARLAELWRDDQDPVDQGIGALLGACRAGSVGAVRFLLDRGIPVDLHPPGSEWGGIGHPGLHHAAVNGNLAVVQLLLERGADVALVDDQFGSTALAWAASGGRAQVVQALLDAGADVGHRNVHGLSAADLADRNDHVALGQKLRRVGGAGGAGVG